MPRQSKSPGATGPVPRRRNGGKRSSPAGTSLQRENPVVVPRLGLACQFLDEPIRFRTTTATSLLRLPRGDQLAKLSTLCLHNAQSLQQAILFCTEHGIGCFRITSGLLPVITHPQAGYAVNDLPAGDQVIAALCEAAALAKSRGLRLVFHPDQYVVLNSPRPEVVTQSIAELEYHAELCDWTGADVINIHGGGAYGDKKSALRLFEENVTRLSDRVRRRLTVENDDKIYTPADLLGLCERTGLPLVYDVHHHRCLPDGMSVEAATDRALATWNREPLVHLSSPIAGWEGPKPHCHRDYIDVRDFPDYWRNQAITIEVEAKAKERAVAKLQSDLAQAAVRITPQDCSGDAPRSLRQ